MNDDYSRPVELENHGDETIEIPPNESVEVQFNLVGYIAKVMKTENPERSGIKNE